MGGATVHKPACPIRELIEKNFPHPLWGRNTLYTPAEYLTVETLPSGKLDSFEIPGLQAIPDRPLFMVCDCCLSKSDRLWILKHYGFCTGFPKAGRHRRDYLEGAWAFCVQCWPLFLERDIETLAARVVTLNSELDPYWVALTYRVLSDAVHGDVMTWNAGQSTPR